MLQITPWEKQALQLIAQGKAPGDIGACLGVAASEVGSHLAALFTRMGAASQRDAVADAVRRGLVNDETS